jgi:hypothetical protein
MKHTALFTLFIGLAAAQANAAQVTVNFSGVFTEPSNSELFGTNYSGSLTWDTDLTPLWIDYSSGESAFGNSNIPLNLQTNWGLYTDTNAYIGIYDNGFVWLIESSDDFFAIFPTIEISDSAIAKLDRLPAYLSHTNTNLMHGGINIDSFERNQTAFGNYQSMYTTSSVPIPGAAWLMGSGLIGIFSIVRRKRR